MKIKMNVKMKIKMKVKMKIKVKMKKNVMLTECSKKEEWKRLTARSVITGTDGK